MSLGVQAIRLPSNAVPPISYRILSDPRESQNIRIPSSTTSAKYTVLRRRDDREEAISVLKISSLLHSGSSIFRTLRAAGFSTAGRGADAAMGRLGLLTGGDRGCGVES